MSRSRHLVLQSIETPIGPLVAAAREEGVCLLEYSTPERLEPQMKVLRRWFGDEAVPGESRHFELLRDELRAYFAGELSGSPCPWSRQARHSRSGSGRNCGASRTAKHDRTRTSRARWQR